MEFGYEDSDLEELCMVKREAVRKLGAPCANQLRHRLADLQAASVVSDLIAGKPHPLERERAGQFAVKLFGAVRLVFRPANQPIPKNTENNVDWSKVTKVTIVYIGNYHD